MADTSGHNLSNQQRSSDKKWLDQIGNEDYASASSTLYHMSLQETNVQKKKTILSLCKLLALISGNSTTFRDIENQLDEIEYHQTLSMAPEQM